MQKQWSSSCYTQQVARPASPLGHGHFKTCPERLRVVECFATNGNLQKRVLKPRIERHPPLQYFWAVLMTFISDVKIDVNMCEPHYVNLFFLSTSSIVQMFDYLTFDIFLTT